MGAILFLHFRTSVRKFLLIDPNQFKRIDIPIISVGEVSGMVYRNNDNSMKGIGRILVKFYKINSKNVIAETLSESEGYIYYLGLAQGEYVARIDSVQVSNLGLSADPPQIYFNIKTLAQGDIVGGIDFILGSEQIESLDNQNIVSEPKIKVPADDDEKSLPMSEVVPMEQKSDMPLDIMENTQAEPIPQTTEEVSIVKDTLVYVPGNILYKVQLLALRTPIRVMGYFLRLLNDVPGLSIEELEGEDGLYHYSTGSFRSMAQDMEFMNLIKKSGWNDCFIAIYKGGKRNEPIFILKHINTIY